MADYRDEIYRRIPHRPPFLWVDRITGQTTDTIETEKDLPPDLALFAGHYPDYPIMPGVILCEAIFQSGALLLFDLINCVDEKGAPLPVLTRIIGARFKREVKPGDTIVMQVSLKEKVGSAWFMKGRLSVAGKTAVQVEFACAMVMVS
jgi:3-hydroxyacyl-[acyl-carrier-protein] dehydratase